jgi:hypothetical protein
MKLPQQAASSWQTRKMFVAQQLAWYLFSILHDWDRVYKRGGRLFILSRGKDLLTRVTSGMTQTVTASACAKLKTQTAKVDLKKNICLRGLYPLTLSKHDAVNRRGTVEVACRPIFRDIYRPAISIPRLLYPS